MNEHRPIPMFEDPPVRRPFKMDVETLRWATECAEDGFVSFGVTDTEVCVSPCAGVLLRMYR